jgi:acetyltransferase-like isoleucine patch superfamily enzyme
LENLHNQGFQRLSIGRHCYIGCETFLDVTGEITIEDEAVLSPRVMVLSHTDVGQRPLAALFPARKHRTILGRGCWLGANAIILGGVQIGENAVVAAGAVVTRDVPPRTVVAGVPARPTRMLPIAERACV